jgi:hypothetical protein
VGICKTGVEFCLVVLGPCHICHELQVLSWASFDHNLVHHHPPVSADLLALIEAVLLSTAIWKCIKENVDTKPIATSDKISSVVGLVTGGVALMSSIMSLEKVPDNDDFTDCGVGFTFFRVGTLLRWPLLDGMLYVGRMSIWKSMGDGVTVWWGVVSGWCTRKFVAIKEGIPVFLGWCRDNLTAAAKGTMDGFRLMVDWCAGKFVAIKEGIPVFLG